MQRDPDQDRPPIFTSIPPHHSRLDAQGNEIGPAHLRRCIESWRECGFEPVTINSERETLHPLIEEMGIRTIRVSKDASAITGRPHVYLADMIAAALASQAPRIYLINADIELEMTDEAKARLDELGPGEVIMLNRTDYSTDKASDGEIYRHGFDFFAAGVECFDNIDFGSLVFGMPWWDHYVPMVLFSKDVEVVSGDGITAWHLQHTGRWVREHYLKFGECFVDLVQKLKREGSEKTEFDEHLDKILKRYQGKPRDVPIREAIKARLLANISSLRVSHLKRAFRDIAYGNEAFFSKYILPK